MLPLCAFFPNLAAARHPTAGIILWFWQPLIYDSLRWMLIVIIFASCWKVSCNFFSHLLIFKWSLHSLKGSSFCVLGSWPLLSWTTMVTTVTLTNIFHMRTPPCMVYTQMLSSTASLSPRTTSLRLCWSCSRRTPLEGRGQLRAQRTRCGSGKNHYWEESVINKITFPT